MSPELPAPAHMTAQEESGVLSILLLIPSQSVPSYRTKRPGPLKHQEASCISIEDVALPL